MDYKIGLPSKPKKVFEEGNSGVYEISGLYAGYGHTLGNSLRRIILSSIPGAGITSVKIEGVPHEFSKINTDEPQTAKISASGITNVTAKDIDIPSQLEIMNKKEHIATLTSKEAKLNIEFTVEKGLGYVSREELKKDKVGMGTIVFDAVFTPIKKVNYEVENMRVGDRTDYNRLRISVETDGSVTPAEAVEKSIETMIHHLKAIIGFQEKKEVKIESAPGKKKEKKEEEEGEERKEIEGGDKEVLKTRVQDLELSARTLNALETAGIRTLGGLAKKKESDLMEIEGAGKKVVQEIKRALGNYGLILK